MQNDQDLISAAKEHKGTIDEVTDALKRAQLEGTEAANVEPAPTRMQRLALFTCDLPWPGPGSGMRESEIEVPAPGIYVGAFLSLAAKSPILEKPGERPQPQVILRVVFQGSPEGDRVFRRLICQPTGTAMAFPEGMPDELKPEMVEVVHNPMTGSVLALWLEAPDPNEPSEIAWFTPPASKDEQPEPAQG